MNGFLNHAVISRMLVLTQVKMDLNFYKATHNVEMFEQTWCVNSVLCAVKDGELGE